MFTFFSTEKPYEADTGAIKFYLTLCIDVLIEILQFGDRRRLTKLEGVGRRFHHLVENWFCEIPFLRLDILLGPFWSVFCHKLKFIIANFIFSGGLGAFIGSDREEVSLANLAKFPPFLRFNKVLLLYEFSEQSLLLFAKCRIFEDCLESIKAALKDSTKISFAADINENDPSQFRDHLSAVIYLRDRLLPICSSSRSYEFVISSDKTSATNLISSILQISKVRSCSNVSIQLSIQFGDSVLLPVEDISNWLAPNTDDGVEIYGKNGENRFLLIYSYNFSNAEEMLDRLKEVNLILVSVLGFK